MNDPLREALESVVKVALPVGHAGVLITDEELAKCHAALAQTSPVATASGGNNSPAESVSASVASPPSVPPKQAGEEVSPNGDLSVASGSPRGSDAASRGGSVPLSGERLAELVAQWRAVAASVLEDEHRAEFENRDRLRAKRTQLEACVLELEIALVGLGGSVPEGPQ